MTEISTGRTAVLTGVTGQDGMYLTKLLLDKGYRVIGIQRRTSNPTGRYLYLFKGTPNFRLVEGDVTDISSISNIVKTYQPDEFYHLAAQSISEDSLCPIMSAQGMRYRTLKDLWSCQQAKNKNVRIESFHGTEVEVIDLPENTQLKALGYWNGVGTWFRIKQISRHRWAGKMAKLTQKFGSVIVTPNHSVLDTQNHICQPKDNPWLLNIRKLNHDRKILSTISGFSGHKLRSLIYFIGAFVTEGHTNYNKTNGSYIIAISNQDKKWLENIKHDIQNVFNIQPRFVLHQKEGYENVWRLEFASKEIYSLLRKWCGTKSENKKLPDWFFNLSHDNLGHLLHQLVNGDGCYDEWGLRYTTKSYHLACQLSMLMTLCGKEYTINCESVDSEDYWHFRECSTYQPNQGQNGKKVQWIDYDGWVYDISVDEVQNFTVGIGNIVVHNSHVAVSFNSPKTTADITGLGTLNCLEALRTVKPDCRFYFAGSSEQFGNSISEGQSLNEDSPMHPASPYAVSKLFGYHMTRTYRESYGMFASCGILFNHEAPVRGKQFVTRKITRALAKIVHNKQEYLELGNLDAYRDWGFAGDYVDAMYRMLQHDKPDDFVVATGETSSIRNFIDTAFYWYRTTKDIVLDWNLIKQNPEFMRPNDVHVLLGDRTKAERDLGWKPTMNFERLVAAMCEYDYYDCSDDPADRRKADQFVFPEVNNV